MDDKIPQSFKVQWLNTTLKFIKNDNQLSMQYPEMPTNYVEYLHNLIWQRKNEVGLGFKSLYSPVWEAMKIFSLKYKFKVFVVKSKDGETGHLIIEKISKNMDLDQSEKKKVVETQPEINHEKEEEINNNSQNTTMETHSESSNTKKKASKNNQTKGQKYYVEVRKIIDSLSSTFIRKTFQEILDFIDDELRASVVFSGLAPVQARFLDNFLGIFNRRLIFSGLFSPACNEILDNMFESFKKFDKNFKLEICGAVTNKETNKREVTFMKVPKYTKPVTSKAKLNKNITATPANKPTDNKQEIKDAKKGNTDKLKATDTANKMASPRSKLLNAIAIPETSNNSINLPTVSKENIQSNASTIAKTKENQNHKEDRIINNKLPPTMDMSSKDKIGNISITVTNSNYQENGINNSSTSAFLKESQNNGKILSPTNNEVKIESKIIQNPSTSIKTVESQSTDKQKSIDNHIPQAKKQPKDNEIVNLTINNSTYQGNVLNKSKAISTTISAFLKDPKDIKSKVQITKNGIQFAKATEVLDPEPSNSEFSANNGTDKQKNLLCSKKNKVFEAMKVPLESDKAMRMMRLMGWEGGALGLRGEGIIEPIIPVYSVVRAGLGHVPEKLKKQKHKQDKRDFRTEFLDKVLELLCEEDMSVSVLPSEQEIGKKERRFLKNAINLFNKRTYFVLKADEDDLIGSITRILEDSPEVSLNLEFSTNLRELKLAKVIDTTMIKKTKTKTKAKSKSTSTEKQIEKTDNFEILHCAKKSQYRIVTLQAILMVLRGRVTKVRVDFDAVIKAKRRRFIEKACRGVNKRTLIDSDTKETHRLAEAILDCIGDTYLEVNYHVNERSFFISKISHNEYINNNEYKKNLPTEATDMIEKKIRPLDETSLCKENNINDNDKYIKTIVNPDNVKHKKNNSLQGNSGVGTSDNSVSEDLAHNNDDYDNKTTNNNVNANNNKDLDLVDFNNSPNCDSSYVSVDSKGNGDDMDNINMNCISIIREMLIRDISNLDMKKKCINKLNYSVFKQALNAEITALYSNKDTDDTIVDNKDKAVSIYTSEEEVEVKSKEWYKSFNNDFDKNENCININVMSTNINEIGTNYHYNELNNSENIRNNDENGTYIYDNDTKVHIGESNIHISETNNYDSGMNIHENKNNINENETNIHENKTNINENETSIHKNETKNDDNETNIKEKGSDLNTIKKYRSSIRKEDLDEEKVSVEYLFLTHNEKPVVKKQNVKTTIKNNYCKIFQIYPNYTKPIVDLKELYLKVQIKVADNLKMENCLPSLKCHGFVNGCVVYGCGNKESSLWLKNVLRDFRILEYRRINHRLQIRINSYLGVEEFLQLLKLYNPDLLCENWKILNEDRIEDVLFIYVEMDSCSFKYVCDNDFSLCAGVDEAVFSLKFQLISHKAQFSTRKLDE